MNKKKIIVVLVALLVFLFVMYAFHAVSLTAFIVLSFGCIVFIILNLHEGIRIARRSIRKMLNEADALYRSNQPNNAMAIFKKVLRLEKNSFEAQIGMGQCYRLLRDLASAVRSFQAAKQLRPASQQSYFFLGLTYLQQNEILLAIKELKEAERLKPDFADLYFFLGEVYARMKEKQDALKYYRKYLEMSPAGKFSLESKQKIETLETQEGQPV